MIISILAGLTTIYFKDFNVGILHEIHDILHGNFKDEYGTYRVFLWKRAIKLVEEAPIIGTGSDTFAIRFMKQYTADVAALGKLTINDTAANVYLTILVNTGILGLIAFAMMVLSLLFRLIKSALTGKLNDNIEHGNTYYYILALGILAYVVQDFFNLWVVIVTPIYFVTMGMLESVRKDGIIENKNIKNWD
jgi:putative inorganic carbon (HCO3(-)) transporter